MADRALLHFSKLDDFVGFMARKGWSRADLKGSYEVLRLVHPDHPPLVLFARVNAREHVTVQRGDAEHVRAYIAQRRNERAARAAATQAGQATAAQGVSRGDP